MTSQSKNVPIVIDASVAIKWFVKENDHEAALEILSKVLSTPNKFAVPELFFYELANILNRIIEDDLDPRFELFEKLLDLNITRAVYTKELGTKIRKFQRLGLSGYDASYVALAEFIGGRWLTADKKAHQRILSLDLSVVLN